MIDKLDELCAWMRKRHVVKAVYGQSSAVGRTHMELVLDSEPIPLDRPMNAEEYQAHQAQIQKDLEEDLFASSEGYSMERLTRRE